MHRIVREYFDRAEFATGQQELCDAIGAAADAQGFHSFAFLALPGEHKQPLLVSTYPKEWTDHYIECGYQGRDPVILNAGRAEEAFIWNADMAEAFGRDARAFFCEAEKFHIRCGLTVPLPGLHKGLSAMSFATDWDGEGLATCLQEHGPLLLFMAYHFRSQLRRMLEPSILMDGIEITPRERECLEWATRGKSRTDTAQIMVVSRRMVVRDLENVKHKLGVRSIGQAIAMYAAWKASGAPRMH